MLRAKIGSFFRDESGATAIEYALLGTLIAVVIAATFALLGTNLESLFNNAAADEIASKAGTLS